jgi:HSP20 family protein
MAEKRDEDESQRPDDTDFTALAVPRFGLSRIFEDFMRPFDEFAGPFFSNSAGSMWTELAGREPVVDFHDRGDHYTMTAELPGFEKKDIEVSINSNVLELRADRSSDKETKSKEGTQFQRSRSYFRRVLTLPDEVLAEKVRGTMKNGVLELRLPKRAPKAGDKSRRVDLK